MDVNDYLIDQSGKDWRELLSGWLPLFPESFTVWLVNRFGDVFAVLEDGSVHMLDVGVGTITRLADNRDHFATLIDQGDNSSNWLLIDLADRCVAASLILSGTQCYGYKVPPILGGEYNVENIAPTDLSVHYSFLADIWRQTKELPNGTKVKLVVMERRPTEQPPVAERQFGQ